MAWAWRPLLREVVTYLLVGVVVVALLLGVWWTRNPESGSLTAARELPWIGPLAGALQDRYIPAPVAEPTPDPPPLTVYRSATGETSWAPLEFVYELEEPRPYVWVGPGTALRREPSFESEPVVELEAMTNLFIDERQGDWIRVRHRGVDGWVIKPVGGSSEDHGDRPAPVVPLPARPPEASVLERARSAMSSTPTRESLGSYALWSDADMGQLLERCAEPLDRLDTLFRRRLGVEPIGEGAEVLLVFDEERAYDDFSERVVGEGIGHAGPGYAATWVGNRSAGAVCETLIHEAAHLTSRRSIGPALPPWLGEGVSEFAKWELTAGAPPLRSRESWPGGFPTLERLTSLDETEFRAKGTGPFHYAASGYWVTYLLQDPELSDRFRAFLAYLARGGPWAEGRAEGPAESTEGSVGPAIEAVPEEVRRTPGLGDDLVHHLGRDYQRLDAGIRAWLWSRG